MYPYINKCCLFCWVFCCVVLCYRVCVVFAFYFILPNVALFVYAIHCLVQKVLFYGSDFFLRNIAFFFSEGLYKTHMCKLTHIHKNKSAKNPKQMLKKMGWNNKITKYSGIAKVFAWRQNSTLNAKKNKAAEKKFSLRIWNISSKFLTR